MEVKVISPTIQEFDGTRYYLTGYYFQRQGKRLHVEVWRYHNGDIPKGYHVHHIDGDRTNNQIGNLQLLEAGMHSKLHQSTEDRKAYQQEHIKDMRELASEWHKSEAGREMHRRIAKEAWVDVKPHICVCVQCGKEFETRHNYGEGQNAFCGNNCRAAWRRKQKKDMEERTCAYCGKSFLVNRYARTECCSRECAVKKRWGK